MSGDLWVTRYARWVLRFRWPILIVTLLLVGLAASGAQYLGFATNYRVFFGDDNPELAAFEALQNIYTKNDNILFVVTPADGNVFTRETLAAIEELTHRAWQIPASIRVDSITNFQNSRAEEDDLIVEDLVRGAAGLSDEQLASLRQTALERPELKGRLIASSADVTGVNVTLQLDGKDPGEVNPPVAFARQLVSEIEADYPHLDLRLSGAVMLNNAFMEAGISDMTTLIPLMYLVLVIAMIALLRSFVGTVATLLVIGFSAITALGLAGWLGTLLEPVSAQAGTMILTMAVADSIHFLVTMIAEMRGGRTRSNAIVESLRINFVPILLTSVTTAIGFLSMNFSDSPPLNKLGNITATGVLVAFALSVSFLPALVAVLPMRVRPRPSQSRTTFFDRLGLFVVQNRRVLLVGMFLLVIVLVSFLPANEVSDRFVRYFDESIEFRRDTDYATENLTGIYQLHFSIDSGDTGGISDPLYLDRVGAFSDWLEKQPGVAHVASIADTLRRLNMNLHGDDPSFYRLPEERNLAAQYLLLFEMSLPYGLDLNNVINVDKSSSRVVATVGDIPTKDFLALAANAEDWLAANAPAVMGARATGPATMFAHITERNIKSMIIGTVLAFLLISLVLIVALRSVKIGLLSLIPNVVPAAMAFGAWGIMVGEIGFAVSVVAAMTMGIVVDDTVHFLSKYLRARREKSLAAPAAVRYAFRSVGQALWVTSAVLVAGFTVLAQSAFKQNAELGLLAAITIVFALVADFFLLPTLLILVDRGETVVEARSVAISGDEALALSPVSIDSIELKRR